MKRETSKTVTPSFDITLKTIDQCFLEAPGKKHLLLGNGFSIGAHSTFQYGELFNQARISGLSARIQGLFDHYGTSNFEAVLRYLDEGAWLCEHYGLVKTSETNEMRVDYESLKEALIQTISIVHPGVPDQIGEDRLRSCLAFLDKFDNTYTLNYDLLLYWASLVTGTYPFEDNFGREEGTDDTYCVFLPSGSGNKHTYYLHGALHLYVNDGEVKKRVWKSLNVPIVQQTREALDNKQYPLVVSEGSSLKKRERIIGNEYLGYCWRKFENIQGSLFTFGASFGDQDDHVLDAIAKNTGLSNLWVGIFGDPQSETNRSVIQKMKSLEGRRTKILESHRTGRRMKKEGLTVQFYQTNNVSVWGS